MVAPVTLGEALRLLLARTKLNREEAAKLAAVSSGAMHNYLNDVSTPSASVLRRITNMLADSLGVNSAKLWLEIGKLIDDPERRQHQSQGSHPHVEIMRHADLFMAIGDFEALLSSCMPDVIVHIPGRTRFSGDHRGEASLRRFLTQMKEGTSSTLRFETHDILANDDHTVLIQRVLADRNGKRLDARIIVLCHLREGRIAEVWVYSDGETSVDEFWL